MNREELNKLVDAYDVDKSNESLIALKDLLKKATIYFKTYYDNTEGKSPVVLNNFQESGKFVDFTESTQFHIPSLLKVQKADGEIVYVSLNEFNFE
jgi:hypothetical protein